MALGRGQMLLAGQIIGGHYRIIKHLGSGNFGETYQAEDSYAMNRKCVVKRLNFVSNNPAIFNKAKELFEREASVLLKLSASQSNGQIPIFLAYFDENEEFYLVQELIDGHPLSDELPGGRKLSEEQVVDLLEDVLGVLKYIHSHGIIHRDLKPENIMRRVGDGKLVLIDFGTVKEVLTQSVNGRARTRGTIIYTEGYAPREQIQGQPKLNSDIYALGMTAIQALTGLEPVNLPEDTRTGQVIWQDQAQVSPELAKILDKMVQENWQRRYQSAEEVLHKVRKLKGTVVIAPTQPKSIQKYKIPLKPWEIIGCIAAVVAALGTVSTATINVLRYLDDQNKMSFDYPKQEAPTRGEAKESEIPSNSRPNREAIATESSARQVTEASARRVFECRTISGAPTTVLINSKGEERQMIRWVSNVIPGYPPERRCREVTDRMNVHFSKGSQYITYGRMNGYNVICITDGKGNDCLPNGLVYRLKPDQDPNTTLDDLLKVERNTLIGPLRE